MSSISPASEETAPKESLCQRLCCQKEEPREGGGRDLAEVEPASEDKDGRAYCGCVLSTSWCQRASTCDLSIDWKVLWTFTGPGWLMSIAYLDPGNLEADLQMGAYTGSSLIWVLWWSTIMGFCLQVMAARLGVVTGMDLAEMARSQLLPYWTKYRFPVHILLWLQVEIAIIGSDIQEVLGSAIAWRLLTKTATYAGFPLWLGALITAFDTFGFLLLHYFGVRKLEAFVCVLIGTMSICFFINVFTAHWTGPEVGEVAIGGVEPLIKGYALLQAVGTVGAVIMPHNLYLHSALVKTRNVKDPSGDEAKDVVLKTVANKYFAIESGAALFTSFLINLAVVAAFSRSFFQSTCAELDGGPFAYRPDLANCDDTSDGGCVYIGAGDTRSNGGFIGTCAEIGLENAGQALQNRLGVAARYIWAIGLLAAGQASTLTGTYAGQFAMEGFMQWRIAPWQRVAITRFFALGPALAVALAGSKSPSTMSVVNEWLNVLQSVQLPFALLPILIYTNKSTIMNSFKNGVIMRVVLWLMAAFVLVINVYTVVAYISDPTSDMPHTWWFYTITAVYALVYIAFIAFLAGPPLVVGPLKALFAWVKAKQSGAPQGGGMGDSLLLAAEGEGEGGGTFGSTATA